MKDLLLVGLGSDGGSAARYALARAVDQWLPARAFPPGILLVNVPDCLLIGVVLGVSAKGAPLFSADARLLLATGVCGGFTTFSTFSHQPLALLSAERTGAALLYMGLGVGLAATAVRLGLTATAACRRGG